MIYLLSMFHLLVLPLFAVLPLASFPQPSASPDIPSGLKEIGHVHASACLPLLTQANAAIDSALQNNTTILLTIRSLHSTRLNGNDTDREGSIEKIDDFATQIDRTARDGKKSVKALRTVAANTTDPVKRQEINALADALSNAIGEQSSIALDLGSFERELQGREPPYSNITDNSGDGFPSPPPGAVRPAYLPDDDAMALGMANDFVSRLTNITNDENTAASSAESATADC